MIFARGACKKKKKSKAAACEVQFQSEFQSKSEQSSYHSLQKHRANGPVELLS